MISGCESLCKGGASIHTLVQIFKGGLGIMGACHLLDVCVAISFTFFDYCFECFLHSYNFQRLMSRLEQRWRAQRIVISIVNCRIPWINRTLNVDCAFGISLKACLLQCPIHFMPATRSASAVGLLVCICVLRRSALDTWRSWESPSSIQQYIHLWCLLLVLLVGILLACLCTANQDMKSGQQTRWI